MKIDLFRNSLCLEKQAIFMQIYQQILRKYLKIWPKNLMVKMPKRAVLTRKWNFERDLIKRKAFVTLLEVIIAMALTVLVLTTLTFFYRQVHEVGKNLDEAQIKSFQMRFLENRLSYVLPRAVSEKKSDFVFFTVPEELGLTKSASLIFTFDNGISIDKPFSNNVLGRLFVDPHDRLILAYWPSPGRWNGNPNPPIKKEVLMDRVEGLGFEFFIPPVKEEEPPAPPKPEEAQTEPEPKGDWKRDSWPIEYNQLPALIRLTLSMQGTKEKISFIFPLPNTKRPITYDQ